MEDNTNTLKVKFNWALRKRAFPTPDHGGKTDFGRTAKYMRNLKERDPSKYREHLKKDANRKREGYITIENKTNSEKEQQRKKWLGWKRKQREKKKSAESSNVKRLKDMTVEEKKTYYKMKMRSYRAKMSKQKKTSEKKKNRESKTRHMSTEVDTPCTTQQLHISGNSSRATFYRRKKELGRVMPKSPHTYGRMVETLVSGNSATPKKVQYLRKRGIRRRLEEDLIAANVKANIHHLSSSCKNKDRQALHAIVTASTTLPICTDTEECGVTQTPPDSPVSQQKHTAPPKVVRGYLGVSRRSWRRVRQHNKGEYITQVKKKRSGIPDMVAETVRNFWLSPTISRPLPLKKRVKRGIPTHLLECSYSTAYQRFKAEHPQIKLGYVKFIMFRPRNVRHMRLADRNVCCCNKCENIKLKVKAINQLAVKSKLSKPLLSSDEASLSNMTTCKFDNSRFPPKTCIDRKCAECGVKNVSNHLQALLNTEATTKVKYQEWQRVEKRVRGKNEAERIIKVVDLVDSEVTLGELVVKLEVELIKFSGHLFRAKWQQHQLKMAKEKINPKSAIVIMDYAENYTCTSQDEVQSAHWVTQAVTIHPMMTYINASSQAGTITNSEALIFISDDLKHDADGVAHFTSIAYPYLQQKYRISQVEEFSDCCAVQYRCGKSFADISFATDVTVRHNYFEAPHGKSVADGMGAITKHAASMAVTRRQYTIRNAKEFWQFCEAELTDVGKSVFQSQSKKNSGSFRSFFYCENIDRNRKDRDAKTVKGTMNIHCVSGMNEPYKIRIRDLSCTCDYCWTGSGDGCQEERYVGTWRTVELQLKEASVVREDKRPQMDNHPTTEEIIPKIIGTSRKVNINFQDSDGMTAVHQAALMGNVDILKVLLESGAAANIKDSKGMRPLHYGAWQGKKEPVALLLQWGSSANDAAHDGMTPLHLACEHGHYEVVKLLLQYKGTPTAVNHSHRTPLDLACEFGKCRVVELLLESSLCNGLLLARAEDMVDNTSATCLHLAARNGHSDVIRVLLQAGMDINRHTLQGTCLHEAAMYGKIEVVRLLLDCGIDVNRLNSFEQTALDIVNKFTSSRAARELKQLLRDASFAVQARAVKDYYNMQDANYIAFKEGDIITVLEQHGSGMWKGYVVNDTGGAVGRTGYFPSSHVVLVDSHAQNRLLSPYRTPTPQKMTSSTSDLIGRQNCAHSMSDISPYTTIGADNSFPPPPIHLAQAKSSSCRDCDRDSGISSQQNFSQQPSTDCQGSYPVRQPSPNSPADRTVEWLGKYVGDGEAPQSSPSSSNRSSTISTNSGSLHNHPNYVNLQIVQQHRLSGQSYESGVSSRHSYHSTSSSSLGSLERLEESAYSSTINVHDLLQQGLSEEEVLRAWLAGLHFDEYYPLFINAGYDLPTMSRMTPEDLTAIGITKPSHRKRLKLEISRLHIHDGIPDFKPVDVREWLHLLHLDIYWDILVQQEFDDINIVTDITWEDLEEIGIKKLGHQKKIMLAIDRLKRIQSISKRLSQADCRGSQEVLEPPSAYPTPKWLVEEGRRPPPIPGPPPSYLTDGRPLGQVGSSGDSLCSSSTQDMRSLASKPLADGFGPAAQDIVHLRQSKQTVIYAADLVPIQVQRTPNQRGSSVPDQFIDSPTHPTCQSFQSPSCETEPNEEHEATSTLKRTALVTPRVSAKPKPVAMIVAKTKRGSSETPTEIVTSDCSDNQGVYSSGTLTRKGHSNRLESSSVESTEVNSEKCSGGGQLKESPLGSPAHPPPQYSTPQVRTKRAPPPPPKRTNSIKGDFRAVITESRPSRTTNEAASTAPARTNQGFSNCVKSLSERFNEPQPETKIINNSSEDTFPPPPPPISVDGKSYQGAGLEEADNPLNDVIQQLENTVKPGNKLDELPADVAAAVGEVSRLETLRNASTTSLDSAVSTGSLESNTLPFANENVGTIKQRNATSKPSIVTVNGDADDEKSVELNTAMFEQDTATIRRRPSLAQSDHKAGPKKVVPPTVPSIGGGVGQAINSTITSNGTNINSEKTGEPVDVLNDIGNMLQGLTDELDAMLELEIDLQ